MLVQLPLTARGAICYSAFLSVPCTEQIFRFEEESFGGVHEKCPSARFSTGSCVFSSKAHSLPKTLPSKQHRRKSGSRFFPQPRKVQCYCSDTFRGYDRVFRGCGRVWEQTLLLHTKSDSCRHKVHQWFVPACMGPVVAACACATVGLGVDSKCLQILSCIGLWLNEGACSQEN